MGDGRMRKVLWLVAVVALLLALAGAAQGTFGWRARAAGTAAVPTKAAKEAVELSGESVEYDANRRVSVLTGGAGGPAVLTTARLTLSADRLEYAEETGQVKVEGNVRLEGMEPDRFVLTARTMTADLKARTARAQGDVRLSTGKAVATAGEAFYQEKERQVVLLNGPEVRFEENVLKGKEIVYSLAEQRVKARGGSRVTVFVDRSAEKGE